MIDDLPEAMIAAAEEAGYGETDNEYVRNILAAGLRVLAEHLKPTPAPAGGMEIPVYGAASIRALAAAVEHPAEDGA